MDVRIGRYGKFMSLLYRSFQIFINKELKKININSSEVSYFMILARSEKEILIQDDFVQVLQIDKAAVARSLKSLEKKGFVTKTVNENNKRQNKIVLTDKGFNVIGDIYQAIQKWNTTLEQDIDKEELEVTINTLQKMIENI